MHRTQISLPDSTYQALKTIAGLEHTTIIEKLREFVQEGVAKIIVKPKTRGKSVLQLINQLKFKRGPKDGSANHDKYLYNNL